MPLAIFDLDHTLINGDSNQAWGELLCELGVVNTDSHLKNSKRFYQEYVDGVLDIDDFLEFALAPLKENDMALLLKWREQFMQEKIQPCMLEKAQACIAAHKERGDFILIITASNNFVVEPIVNALKVDDTLSTTTEVINGQFTGGILGMPCFQQGKITKLEQWLKNTGYTLEGSYFYSDSYNDLPLLEKVTHPIVVDADDKLSALAIQRNWQQLSFH